MASFYEGLMSKKMMFPILNIGLYFEKLPRKTLVF